ncbi:ATPase WRNIP1-like [Pieris brassicae]|uniref:ATPase WRNIP1-like n=1 Tax=Pieris brassicae TaxID=7116 RepID=UPI001E660804|nr:ATPase WRNIP1-like [Pieris brassicae]
MSLSYSVDTNLKDDLFQCPVCERQFSQSIIETHVNKCIFLNTQTENKLKRAGSYGDDNETVESAAHKRIKADVASVSTTSKEFPVSEKTPNKSKVDREMIPITESLTYDKNIPLAEFMRPSLLEDLVGHTDIFGPGCMIHSMLVKKKIPNMILWGPPGCGKTSLANVIANLCKELKTLRFVKLSATMCGVNEVKEVVKAAKNECQFKRHTVLFMDEIHRFNKLQQDTFLPHVESGIITLVGATTENPSFSLNNALLSRCRVIVLDKLSVENVVQILEKTIVKNNLAVIVDKLKERKSQFGEIKCLIERSSLQWLAEMCDGDARIALGALELTLNSQKPYDKSVPCVTLDEIKDGIKRTHILYDKKGDEHYNIISAIQKSIRASDDNAALYWTTRALHGGEDPLYIARRLIRTACEDIGLGDPNALVEAVSCLHGCQHIGMPECDVLLAQCAVRLARAPKSTEVYHAMKRVQQTLRDTKGSLPPIPMHLRNAPTKLMKELGYAKGYNKNHKNISGLTYVPEGMEGVNFFTDSNGC